MKKIMFVLLCIVLFAITFFMTFWGTIQWKIIKSRTYLEVERNTYGEVFYDLPSDGKESTKYDLYLPKKLIKPKNIL